MARRHARAQAGFTAIEVMVVIAIVGIMTALAVPQMRNYFNDQRLKSAARTMADTFSIARAQAIRTGTNQIVFVRRDMLNAALTNQAGTVVPILTLNDGRPGAAGQNCRIDAGEPSTSEMAQVGVNWGVTFAGAARAPGDTGLGPIATGSSFRDQLGANTTWVMFRPDGVPVGVTAACVAGGTGTGGGAIYLTNGTRDYAVVLSPLGGVRVHAWDRATGAWRN
ncbi:MAG TPA: prepilin-type N-terminal cleavage/methylation domain-containing protein [Dongiaceae bacterium]|nr:prepilin-type N-terminal cleavage/methylation domain-containing protein [Dongiaceae bacterium]